MKTTTTFLALLILASSPVAMSAQINIFSDDFNRANSDSVGSEWYEIDKDSDDVAIYNNALRLKDSAEVMFDSAATHMIDTSGMDQLSLHFDWISLPASDTNDYFRLSWSSNNQEWSQIYFDQTNYKRSLGEQPVVLHHENINSLLLSDLSNLSNLYLRFWIELNGSGSNNEGVIIDNISLVGSQMEQISSIDSAESVPEPSELALLSLGLLSLMTVRCQKLGFKKV